MHHRSIYAFPLVFALLGSIVLIASGDDFELAGRHDNLVLGQWHFVAMGIVFNTGLYFLYRWLLRSPVSRSLFWVHFITTFAGMAIFLYLILPWNDGNDLDAMLRGLTWVIISMFLLLMGFICLLILVAGRLLNRAKPDKGEETVELADREVVE